MRSLSLLAFSAAFILGGLVAAFALGNRDAAPQLKVHFYDDLMPGSPMPHNAACSPDGFYESDFRLYCETMRDGTLYFVEYSGGDSRVSYVSYMDLKDTLGDMILVWGPPYGYDCDHASYTFYWADRSVYLVPRYGLSLASTVGFVQFGSPVRDYWPMPGYGTLPYYCKGAAW